MDRKEFLRKGAAALLLGSVSVLAFSQESPAENKKFTIIEKRCDGCGQCFRACRDKALIVKSNGKAAIDSQKCKGCGDCSRFCRRMAIVPLDQKK